MYSYLGACSAGMQAGCHEGVDLPPGLAPGKKSTHQKQRMKASAGKPVKKTVVSEPDTLLYDSRSSVWACLVDSFLQVASFGLWSDELPATASSEPLSDEQKAAKVTGNRSWPSWTFEQWPLSKCHTMMLVMMFYGILFFHLLRPEADPYARVGDFIRYAPPGHGPAKGPTSRPPPPFDQPSVVRPSTKSTGAITRPTTKSCISPGCNVGCNAQPPPSNNIIESQVSQAQFDWSSQSKKMEQAEREWEEFLRESKDTIKKLKGMQLPRPARHAYQQLKDNRRMSLNLRKTILQAKAENTVYFTSRMYINILDWQAALAAAKKYEAQELAALQ